MTSQQPVAGPDQVPGQLAFDEHDCTCPHPPHPPAAHDDGFGCTIEIPADGPDRRPCPCLAGWSFQSSNPEEQ
jgi:hypothetical protein